MIQILANGLLNNSRCRSTQYRYVWYDTSGGTKWSSREI